jgi:hypothetical protein
LELNELPDEPVAVAFGLEPRPRGGGRDHRVGVARCFVAAVVVGDIVVVVVFVVVIVARILAVELSGRSNAKLTVIVLR